MDAAIAHRFTTGHDFEGIPIHAAPGVHDFAALLATTHFPAGARVLDVGAGSGALSARLISRSFEVLATDIDLTGFRASCPATVWDASNEQAPLPAEPGSFDGVCAVEIIEHVENPLATLRNLKRMLKPGGVLILSTPHILHPRSRLKYLLAGSPCYFGPAEYHGSGHRTLLPEWMLRLHLQSEGFQILRTAYAGHIETSPLFRALLPLLTAFGRAFLRTPKADHGDGACVFFVATTQGR